MKATTESLFTLTIEGVDKQWQALTKRDVIELFTEYLKRNTEFVSVHAKEVVGIWSLDRFYGSEIDTAVVEYICKDHACQDCEDGERHSEDIRGITIADVETYKLVY